MELDKIVSIWVSKCPTSAWANLYNYMIHFPVPDKRLATFNHEANESIKKCNQIVLEKTGKGFRKSSADYFLGKGTGLYAIANSLQFPALDTKGETKTDFWRSKEVSEKLERVRGQKDVNSNGVITYKGIQLRFDEKRYPKQSKDDLWFYVGFSVSGPYAYDPVDNDTYTILCSSASESGERKLFELKMNAPKKAKNFSLSSKCFNTHVQSAKLSWESVDSVNEPTTSSHASYSSALQLKSTPPEEQTSKPPLTSQQSGPWNLMCIKHRKWKSVEGTRGLDKRTFQATCVDKKTGKLHHGAGVLSAEKSKECDTHTSEGWDINITSRCPFAHSWMGDTLQYVCYKCTRDGKQICREKRNHEQFIWNLGPYYTEEGTVWKETPQECPEKTKKAKRKKQFK